MILLQITKSDAGQRFDKYLKRQLKEAQSSFIYKMLRKKNIVLNGKKATGSELLCEKDEVRMFLSEETYEKFRAGGASSRTHPNETTYQSAYKRLKNIEIVFENAHILILNKPTGILSQKAKPEDLSANEWLIGYLLETGAVSPDSLLTFKPSVCNRLDRNTSGLLACGKTLIGSRYLSSIIKDKSLEKYYYTLAAGDGMPDARVCGWLYKDTKNNQVTIFEKESDIPHSIRKDAEYIDTAFKHVKTIRLSNTDISLLEVRLFTGKTHQIRAQLGAMGYPIIGDRKYGNSQINKLFYDMGVRNQLLHAYKIVFPNTQDETFSDISGRTLLCDPPAMWKRLTEVGYGDMEIERA